MREFTQDVKIFSETRSAFQPHTCLRTLMNPIIYFWTLQTFNSQSSGWTFFDSSITWVGTWLNTTNPSKSGRVNFDHGIFTQDYWIFVQNVVVIIARFSCNTKIFFFFFNLMCIFLLEVAFTLVYIKFYFKNLQYSPGFLWYLSHHLFVRF